MHPALRWLSLFPLLLAFAAAAPGQGDGKLTVKASFEPATAKPGDEVVLRLEAAVDPQFHAYGSKETTNIPVALDLTKCKLAGLEPVGKPGIPPGERNVTLGIESFPLPHEFSVTQKFKVPAGAKGEIAVSGEFDYQVCDANMCLPPSSAPFAAKLAIGDGSAQQPITQQPAGQQPAGQQPTKTTPPGTKPGLQLVPDEKISVKAECEPATAMPGGTVKLVLHCKVAEAYHAYGTKETTNIPVSLDPAKIQAGGLKPAGAAQIPAGTRAEVLKVVSYPLPHEFDVVQELTVPADAKAGDVVITGELDYQLCTANFCEPPGTAKFRATVKIAEKAAEPAKQEPGKQEPEAQDALDVDPRFTVAPHFEPAKARAGETTKLVLRCTVDPRYHAYGTKETTNIPVAVDPAKVKAGALVLRGAPQVPPGEHAEALGVESFPLPHEFDVTLEYAVPAGTAPGPIDVAGVVDFQICDENMCLPPGQAPFRGTLQVEAGAAAPAPTPATAAAPPPANTAKVAAAPGLSWWALILLSIGGGLFALAMPCTYPMIPITFSFFTKQAEKRNGKVLPLALTYGIGIVVMFTLVGALLSAVIVDVVNHWITNAVIGAVFLFFSFVLFGWINLEPPQAVQNVAGRASRSGGYLGVFFMGATLVISSFTCTAPIVGSLLANVAQYGVFRVAFGMAVFGITMAAPFVFLSLMPTRVKSIPRSGEWMETLKVSLGFVELAASLKFVSMVDFALAWQALPRELFLMLWVAIFGLWALYLFGILRKAGAPNDGVGAGRMAAGMLVTLFCAYFLFGALGYRLDFYTTNFIPGYSAQSVIARVDGAKEPGSGSGHSVGEHRVVLDDQPRAVQLAKVEDKLLLYNFTGFN